MDANEFYVLTLGPGEALVYPRADLAESFGLFVHSMVSTQVNAPARNVRHFLRPAENHWTPHSLKGLGTYGIPQVPNALEGDFVFCARSLQNGKVPKRTVFWFPIA